MAIAFLAQRFSRGDIPNRPLQGVVEMRRYYVPSNLMVKERPVRAPGGGGADLERPTNRSPLRLPCQRRCKSRPWRRSKTRPVGEDVRHCARASHIACACHGALARQGQ